MLLLLGVYLWGNPGAIEALVNRAEMRPLVGLHGGWGPPELNEIPYITWIQYQKNPLPPQFPTSPRLVQRVPILLWAQRDQDHVLKTQTSVVSGM